MSTSWTGRLKSIFAPPAHEAAEYELVPTRDIAVNNLPQNDDINSITSLSGPFDNIESDLESKSLRRVPAPVPWPARLCASRPLPPGGNGAGAPAPGSEMTPGALGKGLQVSTTLGGVMALLAWTSPLAGGLLADLRWGKFKTIAIGTAMGAVSHLLLVYAALPSLLQNGNSFGPFLFAMLILCVSIGLIKANIVPIMGEQYTPTEDYVDTLPSGEKVIIDREATIQAIMASYYASVNLGSFVAIGSTFAEKYVGYWLAFLLPGIVFAVMPPMLWIVHPHLVTSPTPKASALLDNISTARRLLSRHIKLTEDESKEVFELRQCIRACKLFLFFVIYNVADGGLIVMTTSLTGSMTTSGVPNDFLEAANPLFIVITLPILNKWVYPYLTARKIRFGLVKRVVAGFLIAALSTVYCAVLQHAVYQTSPCGYNATDCLAGVSPLSAWLYFPASAMLGISEALAWVSGLEIGYMLAPPSLRAMINGLFHSMIAVEAALVMIFVPFMKDPYLVWPFSITVSNHSSSKRPADRWAFATVVAAWAVWYLFGDLDND
ncbi:hypothetical protein TREMEDRAFT_64193 [Tremella mesenterica DSM 1558]|uniref:uncharacterized protein n=1 Tax=Tremella mesenterica (strain ATCC 24925 / CBS 8224 / DSM 1558 / NBRC 9311 / NRRL Y-6157 / RJB 2259-6 / UBC 559-6) TaxID=578456 RepID=UPI0003F499A6|nr:uncharacterized protein TREMEDRAFT_64193 [Tremella mesenterica DSM 1558]EIW67600.1 hypothetical protein TREMEDRAFT_64193 [Tremella mesenterica DSM 1558]